MADTDIVWPVGTTDRDPDLSARPMVFNPTGFLVAILPDADAAEQAATALHAAGFAEGKLRIFSSAQILGAIRMRPFYPDGGDASHERAGPAGRNRLEMRVPPGRAGSTVGATELGRWSSPWSGASC